jgi:hypothetical protein
MLVYIQICRNCTHGLPQPSNKHIHHGSAIADIADQPRQISPPHPPEPLRQRLDEPSVVRFHSIMPTSQDKN